MNSSILICNDSRSFSRNVASKNRHKSSLLCKSKMSLVAAGCSKAGVPGAGVFGCGAAGVFGWCGPAAALSAGCGSTFNFFKATAPGAGPSLSGTCLARLIFRRKSTVFAPSSCCAEGANFWAWAANQSELAFQPLCSFVLCMLCKLESNWTFLSQTLQTECLS